MSYSNVDAIYLMKLDMSDIDCNGILLLTSHIDNVIFSQNSNVSLSQFSIDSTNSKKVFTVLNNSLMNSTVLNIVNSSITFLVISGESTIEFNQMQLLHLSLLIQLYQLFSSFPSLWVCYQIFMLTSSMFQ
ncbi:hypothetical protein GEMRC1_008585 [Eukaryota sp. GEM-RC1]